MVDVRHTPMQALAACMHALQMAEEDADGAHSRQHIVAALTVNAGPSLHPNYAASQC